MSKSKSDYHQARRKVAPSIIAISPAPAKRGARNAGPGFLESMSCVLAIGGLDPGGGAGILADARAIERAGAFASAALAVLTIQSTSGLKRVTPLPALELIASCKEVLTHQRVKAIKIGALGSHQNARAVANLLSRHPQIPAVLDTVMIPTRGRTRLLDARAVALLRDQVLRHAALVTVNAPEAQVLTGLRIKTLDHAHDGVRALLDLGARAVLLKGGHLQTADAIDLLGVGPSSRTKIIELRAPRLALPAFHGGGCVLASLIAGRLAVAEAAYRAHPEATLVRAVRWAKKVHHSALKRTCDIGGKLRVLVM